VPSSHSFLSRMGAAALVAGIRGVCKKNKLARISLCEKAGTTASIARKIEKRSVRTDTSRECEDCYRRESWRSNK
jgi:hypothetical protein